VSYDIDSRHLEEEADDVVVIVAGEGQQVVFDLVVFDR